MPSFILKNNMGLSVKWTKLNYPFWLKSATSNACGVNTNGALFQEPVIFIYRGGERNRMWNSSDIIPKGKTACYTICLVYNALIVTQKHGLLQLSAKFSWIKI